MAWVNLGAHDKGTYSDFATKRAFKDKLLESPNTVELYVTDLIGPNAHNRFNGTDFQIGTKYTVTGPNPYKSRKWYATVEKRWDGKIIVT